jgi:hypothetical protein
VVTFTGAGCAFRPIEGILAQEGEMSMLKSVEGVYRAGKIELCELPSEAQDETRVIVTFLDAGAVDLQARGIDREQAADLRARLNTFAEDWDSPEMAAYDHYDAAKTRL